MNKITIGVFPFKLPVKQRVKQVPEIPGVLGTKTFERYNMLIQSFAAICPDDRKKDVICNSVRGWRRYKCSWWQGPRQGLRSLS